MDPRLTLGLFILGFIIAAHLWCEFTGRMVDRAYEQHRRTLRDKPPAAPGSDTRPD